MILPENKLRHEAFSMRYRCNKPMFSACDRKQTIVCSNDETFCSSLINSHCKSSCRP